MRLFFAFIFTAVLVSMKSFAAILIPTISPPAFVDCAAGIQAGILQSKQGWLFERGELRETFPEIESAIPNIKQLAEAFTSQGILLIPILIPLRPMIYLPINSSKDNSFAYDFRKSRGSYESINKELRSMGIIAPNILSALLKQTLPPTFFYGDHHITSAGAHQIALAVLNILRARPEYQSLKKVKFNIIDELPTIHPDPSRTGLLKIKCGKQPDEVFIPVHSESQETQGLLNGAEPDVVYVGTSMGRSSWGLVANLENVLSIDILDAHLDAGGSVTPMIDYLSSLNYRQNKPKIILWEWSFEEAIYERDGIPKFVEKTYYDRILAAMQSCVTKLKSATISDNSKVILPAFKQGDFVRLKSNSALPDTMIVFNENSKLNIGMPARAKNRMLTSQELPVLTDSMAAIQFSTKPDQPVTLDFCRK